MKLAAAAVAVAALTLTAPTAHADDQIFQVGTDIQPGAYFYAIQGDGLAYWKLCSTPSCDLTGQVRMSGPLTASGGRIGSLQVPADAAYVYTSNLTLAPAAAVMQQLPATR